MRTAQRPALDPDFVFDMSQAATDERLVARIGEIRTALDDGGFDPARRDLLVGVVQMLAFVGATPDQAVQAARDVVEHLQGSEAEFHHDIGSLRVRIVAGEPVDDVTDSTVLEIEGDPLISVFSQHERMVETDIDWFAVDGLARRTLLA